MNKKPKFILVNGEQISTKEAAQLVGMIRDDAKEVAGQFHNMNRSEKFRVNWPNEYYFAESEWKSFVEAVRLMYTERLADPLTSDAEKRKLHLALVIEHMVAQAGEADNRLQIKPNTQQFVGDPFENRKIKNQFGTAPDLKAAMKNSTAAILAGI